MMFIIALDVVKGKKEPTNTKKQVIALKQFFC